MSDRKVLKASGLLGKFRGCLQEAKVILQISRKFHRTYVLSLVLLVCTVGLAIAGALQFRSQLTHSREAHVRSLVDKVAAAIQLDVHDAFLPVASLAAFIHHDPDWADFYSTYNNFLDVLAHLDPSRTSFPVVDVLPNGHGAAGYPSTVPHKLIGMDVLADANRDNNLASIQTDQRTFFPIVGADHFAIQQPLFVPAETENDTFGFDKPPTNCSVCYDPVKKLKFWGFIVASMVVSEVVDPRVQALKAGYKYALICPTGPGINNVVVRPDAKLPSFQFQDKPYSILRSSTGLPNVRTSVVSEIPIGPGSSWFLIAEVNYTDIHQWAGVVLAVSILGACVLSVMLYMTLVSRCKLQMLLQSLVPESVIQLFSKKAQYLEGTKPILTAGSPADLMLHVAAEIAAGRLPPIHDALTLRTAILKRWDMYTPINLGDQLQQAHLETDVAGALMQQLVGPTRESKHDPKPNQRRSAGSAISLRCSAEVGEFDDLQSGLRAVMRTHSKSVLDSQDVTGSMVEDDSTLDFTPRSIAAMPLDEAERALALAENCWQFDAFELSKATNGRPLSTLAFFLIHRQALIYCWKLDTSVLVRYLRAIESGYPDNPYHNRVHAADVLQTTHMILHHGGLIDQGYAGSLIVLACYLAAVVHDYGHGGLTNDFLVNTQDDLACLYNDRSPLENHHVAAALALLKKSDMNFLRKMPKPEFITLRKTIIDLVLGTDMKQHFATITAFKASTDCLVVDAMETAVNKTGKAVRDISDSQRQVVLQMAVKCADLGHTAAELGVHKKWLACLEEEFFSQGDKESTLGLPISPLFDRSKPGASKSQTGFYNVVVLPMYTAFCAVFPACNPLLEGAKANYAFWQFTKPSTCQTVSAHSSLVNSVDSRGSNLVLEKRSKQSKALAQVAEHRTSNNKAACNAVHSIPADHAA